MYVGLFCYAISKDRVDRYNSIYEGSLKNAWELNEVDYNKQYYKFIKEKMKLCKIFYNNYLSKIQKC